MFDVVHSQRLDDRDYRLIEIVGRFNTDEKVFTYEDVAAITGHCVRTIAERMRRLRKKGLIKSKRIRGTRSYEHSLVYLDQTSTDAENAKGTDHAGLVEGRNGCLQPLIRIRNKKELGKILLRSLNTDKRSVGIKIKPDNIANYVIRRSVEIDPGSNLGGAHDVVEEVDVPVTGSDDILQHVIDSALAQSTVDLNKTKAKRKKNRERNAASAGRQLYQTRHSKKMQSHAERAVEDYTHKDLEIVFRQQWEAAGFATKAFVWTRKENGQMRNFLKEQSAADIVKYFEYVFSNWDRILKRYAVRGLPTVGLIYGFRRSWFAECFDGEKGSVGRGETTLLEYNPENAELGRKHGFSILDGKYLGRNTLEYNPEAAAKALAATAEAEKKAGVDGLTSLLRKRGAERASQESSEFPMPRPPALPTPKVRVPLSAPVKPQKQLPKKRTAAEWEALLEPSPVVQEPVAEPEDVELDDLLGSLDDIASLSLDYGFGEASSADIVGSDSARKLDKALEDRSKKCRNRR